MQGAKKSFFDTNILVYQYDFSDPSKQHVAERVLREHLQTKSAVISSQVVQEFLNVALSKFRSAIPQELVPHLLRDLLQPLCVHFPDIEYYKQALELKTENSLSFYDALIVQAALDLGCSILYSEDLQNGQKFGTLIIKNPFV